MPSSANRASRSGQHPLIADAVDDVVVAPRRRCQQREHRHPVRAVREAGQSHQDDHLAAPGHRRRHPAESSAGPAAVGQGVPAQRHRESLPAAATPARPASRRHHDDQAQCRRRPPTRACRTQRQQQRARVGQGLQPAGHHRIDRRVAPPDPREHGVGQRHCAQGGQHAESHPWPGGGQEDRDEQPALGDGHAQNAPPGGWPDRRRCRPCADPRIGFSAHRNRHRTPCRVAQGPSVVQEVFDREQHQTGQDQQPEPILRDRPAHGEPDAVLLDPVADSVEVGTRLAVLVGPAGNLAVDTIEHQRHEHQRSGQQVAPAGSGQRGHHRTRPGQQAHQRDRVRRQPQSYRHRRHLPRDGPDGPLREPPVATAGAAPGLQPDRIGRRGDRSRPHLERRSHYRFDRDRLHHQQAEQLLPHRSRWPGGQLGHGTVQRRPVGGGDLQQPGGAVLAVQQRRL